MIATQSGRVTAHALEQLSDRGVMFVVPGDQIYEGQIVGEHCKDNDIPVNATRLKKLTNVRMSTKEATVVLKAPRLLSLEGALEYIEQDELVEITPKAIRMRKRHLQEAQRRRLARQVASQPS
jgi:GTP-binding protein